MKPAWVGEGAASGPDPRTGRCAAHGSWPGGTEPLLGHRFLRHVPVVYVDYPGPASLTQIYGTFNRAMLRLIPSLRTYAEPLTAAMVEFYTMSQVRSSASGRRAPRGDWAFSEPLCRCRPGLPLPVLHPQSGSCPFGPRLYVCADEFPLRSRACTVPSLKGHAPWSQQHERAHLVLLQLAATALPERSPGPGRRHPRQPRCVPLSSSRQHLGSIC